MAIGYVRVHNTLYLCYIEGKQRAEIDDDEGHWVITLDGDRKSNLKFKDLRDAKKSLENMIMREYDSDGDSIGC